MRTCLFLFGFLAAQSAFSQIYYVRFPDDAILVNQCNIGDLSLSGQPVFYNPDSLPLVATYQDEVFGITPVCYTVTRAWLIYNGDTYDPGVAGIAVPNPSAESFSNFMTNLAGPVVSRIQDPADPWAATITKIHPADTALTNYSMFWDSTANAYRYNQLIHIIDSLPPLVSNCSADTLAFADSTANDTLLWNEPYWSEPNLPWHDLRECPVDISIAAFDSCSGMSIGAQYLLFLDLDQDGTQETVVRSGTGFPSGTVQFNNINAPNYNGGTLKVFDERPVANSEKYLFDVERTEVNGQAVFAMRWRGSIFPYNYVIPQLPPGTHRIQWTVSDGCGNATTCSAVFQVTGGALPPGGFQNVFIRFPDDIFTSVCNYGADYGAPELFNPDSANIQISFENQVIDVVPDACYKIERTWTIRNADTYDPLLPCTAVPNPMPSAILNHPSNLPGPVISPAGTSQLWAPTVVKIAPTAPEQTDFSTFWSPYANCYQYTQSIKVIDNQVPVLLDCPAGAEIFNDSSANDLQLWNASYWLDPLSGSTDLKEGLVDLSLTATDSCSGPNVVIRYLLFIDLDQDGMLETVVNSANPPPPGKVRFNNIGTPNFAGGELRQFDQRGLPEADSYQFALTNTVFGDQKTAAIRWNTPSAFSTYTLPQLPPGAHKVKWFIGDDCGNETVCEAPFTVISPLSGLNAPSATAGNYLFPPEPNPFDDQTTIRFRLCSPGPVRFLIHDATGRLLLEKTDDLPAGEHSFLLKKDQLGGVSGLLICQMECGGQLLVQKMVLK